MVKREDDRPTLVASVDPARCVSCGICAGSCAPMGIGPPGRAGRDQLAVTRSALAVAGGDGIPIVAICCEQAPARQVAELRLRGAYVHPVSCVGNVHSSVIELFVRNGAPGVIVFGCPPRDCVSREGPKWLHERVFNDREAELQARVDRRRVRIATIAPGAGGASIEALGAFARDLSLLDKPHRKSDAELDVVCDSVISEEAAS